MSDGKSKTSSKIQRRLLTSCLATLVVSLLIAGFYIRQCHVRHTMAVRAIEASGGNSHSERWGARLRYTDSAVKRHLWPRFFNWAQGALPLPSTIDSAGIVLMNERQAKRCLEALVNSGHVESLCIELKTDFTNEHAALFSKLHSLQWVDVILNDAAIQTSPNFFASCFRLQTLESLSISGTELTGDSFPPDESSPCLARVQIEVDYCDGSVLRCLSKLPALEDLTIFADPERTQFECEDVLELRSCPEISSVALYGCFDIFSDDAKTCQSKLVGIRPRGSIDFE